MLFCIDTEASGPCPMKGDVIEFAAVVVEPGLTRSFASPIMLPMFEEYREGAYNSIGMTRAEHLAATATLEEGFQAFATWLEPFKQEGRLTMVSDNPAFDWQWINWGFHMFVGENPFGYSARRIGDMWSGLQNRLGDHSSWKRFRQTTHTHKPLDDAMGNAEALLHIWKR